VTKTQITHLKLARYPELLTGPPRPIHYDVDPSSACDHACRGCPYIYDVGDGEPDPMLGVVRLQMAKDQRQLLGYVPFLRFVQQAAALGAKAITFVGGGEPTLNPDFTDMMYRASEYVKFGLISHLGRRYDNQFFDALQRATWVRVSLNAATPWTYEDHQGRNHFYQAMANMTEAARRGINVGASFLVTKSNFHEAVYAARLVKATGAGYIQFKPLIETDATAFDAETVETIEGYLDLARGYADSSFQVLNQWASRRAELADHTQAKFSGRCHVPRFNPKLGANGTLYTCCELAYSDAAAIGNIHDTTLEELLARAGERVIDQAGCPHCWDKPVNTLINEGRIGEVQCPPESVDQEFV